MDGLLKRGFLKAVKSEILRCSRGFTLIELVIVMVMSAIIMAVAAMSLGNVVRRHAAEELVSELHLARLMAIRQHRSVTVTFDQDTARCTVAWGTGEKVIDMGSTGEQYRFDPAPPGGPPPPDIAFIFSPLGFISTNPGGNVAGNIYITNRDNSRRFQIQTTIAGGIDLNRYEPSTNTWVPAH